MSPQPNWGVGGEHRPTEVTTAPHQGAWRAPPSPPPNVNRYQPLTRFAAILYSDHVPPNTQIAWRYSLGSAKESRLVASPRPLLADVVSAARRNDVVGTRAALEAYDSVWNGIEVYVSTRSRPHYQEIEGGYQRKIEELLRASDPDLGEIVPLAQAMLAKYDEAIQLSETGPDLSPLFDDVAAIRLARAGLRGASSALKAGDSAKAAASFKAFQQAWPDAQGIMRAQSAETCGEIEAAIGRAAGVFQQGNPTAAELTPAVDALIERYNAGLNLVVGEARKTLPT